MTRRLKPEHQADRDEFVSFSYDGGGCSCFISPPCGWCTHPGNPLNQEEDEFYEEDIDEDDRCEHGMFYTGAGACPACRGD